MSDDDYKLSWAPGVSVIIAANHADRSKNWCRRNLARREWTMDAFTDSEHHTLRFATQEFAANFSEAYRQLAKT